MTSPTIDRRLGLIGNTAIKAPVTVLAASNITLYGEQTIDGIAVLASNSALVPDRVLCMGQTDETENGIWDVSASTWSRSLDANGNYDLARGTTVQVTRGNTYAGSYWRVAVADPITIGTTEIAWERALSSSIDTLSFLQAGADAVSRGAQDKMRDIFSAFDFMTEAERTDVQAGTLLVNVTDALRAASAAVAANDGGTLYLPPGKYLVGKQTFQGTLLDGVTPCAYGASEILTVKNCTRLVHLIGYGAVLKAAAGLRYGSFDPVTGDRYDPVLPFADYDYYGYAYRAMINVEGNEAVIIEGFELDGNNTLLELGGYFGDSNWQLEGSGIWDRSNKSVVVRNVYSHHQPLDGAITGYPGLTEASPPTPHLFENFRSRYNGRQGHSIVGGIGFTLINYDLSQTGQATNTVSSELMRSSPGCGLDIEPESSVVRDVVIINPHMVGNWRRGLIAASGNSRRVRVRGGKIENAVCARPDYHFEGTLFLGYTSFALAAADPYTLATRTADHGFRFTDCQFSYDATWTESGTLVDDAQSDWDEALWSVWRYCVIDTAAAVLPAAFRSPLAANSMVWEHNSWRSTAAGAHGCSGYFRGINQFTLTDGSATFATLFGVASRLDYGNVTLNGANIAGGVITQNSSKATTVILNTPMGQITMNNASLNAATTVSFTLTCASITSANDTVVVHRKSGGTAGAYNVWVDSVASGSCVINVQNITAGALGEAIVLQFRVTPGAIA